MKWLTSFAGVCLFSISLVEGATICRTVVLPDQDTVGFKTIIPPRTFSGVEPVVYHPPSNASAVGLEFWAHRVHTAGVPDPPKDYVGINGYIVNSSTGAVRLIMPQASRGPAWDGVWVLFAMSTFLHQDEYFVVGLANAWDKPVSVDVIITIRECVTN